MNMTEIMSMFNEKNVLITGGTGSLGQALTSRLLESKVNQIRIFSRNEFKQIEMETKFQEYFVHAMAIPHQIDDFSELAKIVNLPKKTIPQKPKRRRQPTSS